MDISLAFRQARGYLPEAEHHRRILAGTKTDRHMMTLFVNNLFRQLRLIYSSVLNISLAET